MCLQNHFHVINMELYIEVSDRISNHSFDLFDLRSWKTKHSLMTQGGSFSQI
jgi:hypothetical protein